MLLLNDAGNDGLGQKATCSVSEKVVGASVERHRSDQLDRHDLLGYELRRVENVEGNGSPSHSLIERVHTEPFIIR
jgi:hypothetical protein